MFGLEMRGWVIIGAVEGMFVGDTQLVCVSVPSHSHQLAVMSSTHELSTCQRRGALQGWLAWTAALQIWGAWGA